MPGLASLLTSSRNALDRLRLSPEQPQEPAAPVPPSPPAGGVSGTLSGLLDPYRRAVAGTPSRGNPFADLDPVGWVLDRAARSLMAQGVPASEGGSVPSGADLSAGGLVTRRGATLTPAAMAALVQAAREYKAIKGTRELGLFGPQATYRTQAEQAALYAAKPDVAAPPGQSLHQQGRAIDLPAQLQNERFFNILRSLGWWQLPSEPWHWSAPGFRG